MPRTLSWAVWLMSRLTFSQVAPAGTPASGLAVSAARLAFLAAASAWARSASNLAMWALARSPAAFLLACSSLSFWARNS